MIITAIFLITCIITARVLKVQKMRIASVIYSILSIILIDALLLTSDLTPVRFAFENLMGEEYYMLIKETLTYALYSSGYGSCILIAFFTTLFLQVVISFIYLLTNIVKSIKIIKEVYLPKEYNYKNSYTYQVLTLRKNINLLYCRMLN